MISKEKLMDGYVDTNVCIIPFFDELVKACEHYGFEHPLNFCNSDARFGFAFLCKRNGNWVKISHTPALIGKAELTLADFWQKDVVDAVNELRGEVPQMCVESWTNAVNDCYVTFRDGAFSVDDDDVYGDDVVCSKSEFNQCVEDMANAEWLEHGLGSYEEYKKAYPSEEPPCSNCGETIPTPGCSICSPWEEDRVQYKKDSQGNRTEESTAVATLSKLGYTWCGGELWKPPVGSAPDYITEEDVKLVEDYKIVTDDIFDLREEFESDELYYYNGGYSVIESYSKLFERYMNAGVYRKVKRPMTWKDELEEHLENCTALDNKWIDLLADGIAEEKAIDELKQACAIIAKGVDDGV